MAGSTRTKNTGTAHGTDLITEGNDRRSVTVDGALHAAAFRPALREREVMDIRQAAEYLGISPDSLYKYASDNFIPAFKLGNRWRFKRSLLETWMELQSAQQQPPLREKNIKLKQKKPVSRVR